MKWKNFAFYLSHSHCIKKTRSPAQTHQDLKKLGELNINNKQSCSKYACKTLVKTLFLNYYNLYCRTKS